MLDRLILKENEIFAVTDREGNIRAHSIDGQGLYSDDTRFLSVYDLSIDDVPLQLLSAAGELNFMNNFQFANLPSTLPDDVTSARVRSACAAIDSSMADCTSGSAFRTTAPPAEPDHSHQLSARTSATCSTSAATCVGRSEAASRRRSRTARTSA